MPLIHTFSARPAWVQQSVTPHEAVALPYPFFPPIGKGFCRIVYPLMLSRFALGKKQLYFGSSCEPRFFVGSEPFFFFSSKCSERFTPERNLFALGGKGVPAGQTRKAADPGSGLAQPTLIQPLSGHR